MAACINNEAGVKLATLMKKLKVNLLALSLKKDDILRELQHDDNEKRSVVTAFYEASMENSCCFRQSEIQTL